MDGSAGVTRILGASPSGGEERTYIPGVCNIGPAEISKRRRAGWMGAVATAVLWAALAVVDAPPAARLLLFFPAMMAAVGFLQAAMHFCAYFGFASLFNFGPEAGKTESVTDAEFRRRDRRKAWQIVSYATLIGVAVAAAGYVL